MILDYIKNFLWIIIMFLLIICGLYFSIKLRFMQINFKKMIGELFKNDKNNLGISSTSSLMLSLAGRIGVGSISGVALAIYFGGPGVVFWIWTISFFSAIIGYVEGYLGVKYKQRGHDNSHYGGPAFYIKKALNKPKLGALYAIMIIICYCGGFMLIQSNTITKSVSYIYSNTNHLMIGLFTSILTIITIFGGIKAVTKITSNIVPVMSLGYIGIAVFILLSNTNMISSIFLKIINSAFSYKSFFAGFVMTMLMGIQRGIFSCESGMGTGAMAAAVSESNNSSSQGLIQMLGIYITSFLICTSTAIIILSSDYNFLNFNDPNGIELALFAFKEHLGNLGSIFLLIAIFLFAFSTILSGYFYGETSLKYLIKDCKKRELFILKIVIAFVIFLGSLISSSILWRVTDILVAILTLINIYAIIKLRYDIRK